MSGAGGVVLVTSAGAKRALVRAVRHAARRLPFPCTVLAADIDPLAPAAGDADAFATMPPATDAALDEIVAFCRAHGIRVVVPTRDAELEFWARHRAVFHAAGVVVVVSAPEAVAICTDKARFATFGQSQGWPVIPVLPAIAGDGPFVVKERFGSGSRSVGVALTPEAARAHASQLAHPIVQPYVRGQEISIDAWSDEGHRVKGLVLRTRDRVVGGESVVTTTFRDPILEQLCGRVLERLPLRGPSVLQMIRSADGRVYLLELNARVGGASTCGIAAGLDIWYWSLLEAFGGDVGAVPFIRRTGEIRQLRDADGCDRVEVI